MNIKGWRKERCVAKIGTKHKRKNKKKVAFKDTNMYTTFQENS